MALEGELSKKAKETDPKEIIFHDSSNGITFVYQM